MSMKDMPSYAVLIVTYNGQDSISRLLRHLQEAESSVQPDILIVDNASTDQTLSLIEQAEQSDSTELTLLKNSTNLGLGKAFNQGMEYFKEKQVDWVLILDQDSFVSNTFFSRFEALFNAEDCLTPEVAAICANAVSETAQAISHRPYCWNGYSFYDAPDDIAQQICRLPVVVSAISSGTFYRPATVMKYGGFKESYFIDFIDHECHLRLFEQGHIMLWNQSATFYHNLGIKQQHRQQEVWIEHSAYRYYYMARNMAHGFYVYGGVKGLLAFLKTLPAFVRQVHRCSEVPWAITGNIVKGLFHAAIARMGKK